ncbi:MAG TPA: cytochrome b/b6 domain-containing protein [Candidatus Limnocylindrales bacterium]|nr:cytochrome b/b6 domain-containing protein [Candidatus Limnocylindrales bacterium]
MNRFRTLLLPLLLLLSAAAQNAVPGESARAGQGGTQPAASVPANELCISCHSDVAEKLQKQAHAIVACQTCHLKHEEYPHPEGTAKPSCATCHSSMVSDYARGVHGQAVSNGNGAAPDCAACHGKTHEIASTKTTQFRAGVPELCGACHADVVAEYQESVHGQAIAKGIMQAPVCTDCHGEHSILPPKDAASSVHPNHIRDTCGGCHNNVRLSRRFGLPSDRIISFDASFHGLASKSGAQTVANCASCHGVHNIRASSDPKSTIYPGNLAKTCGQCHVKAGQRFAVGTVHTLQGKRESAAEKWVRRFYLLIIPLTIGFMFLHNFGDWLHKLVRLRFSSPAPQAPTGEKAIRTFPFERVQHATLAISFIVLAWTGFALKYPDQWWARPTLLWENSHSARGIIHRVASVIFMSAALAHVLSLIFNRRLRDHWRELFPRMRDVREMVRNFAYNLGFLRRFPGRSPHSYIEKMEYWALVWGSVVMVASGLLLWGNNLILRYLPKVVLDVATSVHFYEAVLATLAIVVWHFYFVIFDPDVYPMDSAWLTGKSPRQEPPQPDAVTGTSGDD